MTPFRIEVPDRVLDDLRDRLRRTRWPEPETVDDWSQGIPLAYLQDLCAHWAGGYDWRATEARLDAWPHLKVPVGGLGIHVLHARSPHPDALPLVLTHGRPEASTASPAWPLSPRRWCQWRRARSAGSRTSFGLPERSGGLVTTGGSMATLVAVVAARTEHLDRPGHDLDRGTIYVTAHTHQSLAKAARIAGLPARPDQGGPDDRGPADGPRSGR
jgi:Epoxide hydrolase N terminus